MRKQSTLPLILALITFLPLSSLSKVSAHEQTQPDERNPVCLKAYPTDPAQFKGFVRHVTGGQEKRTGHQEYGSIEEISFHGLLD